MPEKKNLIRTTGRRKTAVANVRLLPGSGAITVNDRSLEEYFPRDTSRMRILEPFELTETKGQYDVIIKVKGGGVAAQADAVTHARSSGRNTVGIRPASVRNTRSGSRIEVFHNALRRREGRCAFAAMATA